MDVSTIVLAGLAAGVAEPHRTTVFLDFDGHILVPGDNSSEGEASCISQEFAYPGFDGSDADAQAITEATQALVSDYGIRVVREEPPPELPFVRVLMGGDPGEFGLAESRGGAACAIDCDDGWWRDTAFVFTRNLPTDPAWIARVAIHETAHTWGLEHVEGEEHLMFEFSTPNEQGWAMSCVVGVEEAGCAEQHERHCDAGEQNSHAELLELFGSGEPDVQAPSVRLLSPKENVHVLPGTVLEVEFEVTDDFGGFGWKVFVPELGWEHIAYDGETSFELPLPMGEYRLIVQATDHGGNVGSAEVSIRVDEDAPAPERVEASCACRGDPHRRGRALATWILVAAIAGRRRTVSLR